MDHLTVDRRVQRAIDPKRARAIAAELDFAALGTLIVSHRADGTFHVVDGQTRVAALKEAGHGEYEADCKLFEGLTLAEEAKLFRLYNNTKTVRPTSKFTVRVIEGDPKAVALNQILERNGWKVTGAVSRGHFSAVGALEWVYDGAKIYEGGNLDACDTVVNVLTVAFGMNEHGVRAELIKGLGLVVLRYGEELDLRKLATDLSTHDGGPLGVIGDARQLRRLRSANIADAMAEVLVGMVNKGRRTKRLPEWREAA
ncbi:DUF6551 family protein [Amycolatopsis sp. NPDC021455]|uniref:DUF6551 family protein n=1 Tax=Amycolatopsis sp. NPDC021455 TaxID=3154901 RepID=UPI0033DEAC8D